MLWKSRLKRHQNYICRIGQDTCILPLYHKIQLKPLPPIQNMPRHVKTLKRTPTVVFSKRSTFKAQGNAARPVARWQMPILTNFGPELWDVWWFLFFNDCQLLILGVNKFLAIAKWKHHTEMQNSERSLGKTTRNWSTVFDIFRILPFTVLRTF